MTKQKLAVFYSKFAIIILRSVCVMYKAGGIRPMERGTLFDQREPEGTNVMQNSNSVVWLLFGLFYVFNE